MKKFVSFLVLAMILAPFTARAQQPAFSLPANAVEVAPNVFSLGKAYDAKTHQMVEGFAIVHKKGDARSNNAKPNKPGGSTCYGYLATGAKWKVAPEPWQLNPANSSLDANFLLNTTAGDIGKWETAASHDILGNGQLVSGAPTDKTVLDDINEVSFGALSDNSTIAVTTVWGIFSGPTFNRQLVEWDQVFNTHYDWSASGETNKMDFENISTHELGHAVGMGDIYTSSCSQVTMYGYADFGQTNKRSLETPDITGISALYR